MSKLFVILGLLLGLALPTLAQETSPEDTCFQKGGVYNEETQGCDLNAGLDIQVAYPLWLTENEFVEQTIDQFVNTSRTNFVASFMEGGLAYYSPGPWSLYINFEETAFSEDIQSVKVNLSDYTGGAHPNSYSSTFTFDLAQNKVLTLDALFLPDSSPLETIWPIVQTSLQSQLTDISDADWIEQGAGLNPDNYQNFMLTEDALIFHFDPYQVAPYVAGPQMVSIPLADLQGILAVPFQSQ
jgi:hypothetical protein